MQFTDVLHQAVKLAYQYGKSAVILLDVLQGLRILLAPHQEYLDSEPNRYHLIASVSPEGAITSLIG